MNVVQVYQEEEVCNSLLKMFVASFRSKETAGAYDYHLKRYCNDLETVQELSSLLTMTAGQGRSENFTT